MKKTYIFPLFVVAVAGLSLQNSTSLELAKYHASNSKNGGGSAPGRTGAPGEGNCTDCHSGSVLDGANENVLFVVDGATSVTQYVPGSSYTISLAMSSNPAKKGFQATALDATGAMAGTFTAGTTTSVNGTTKKYANHKSTSNTNATPLWTWTWTAPATNVGNVTFYVASNKANNDGGTASDQIYLSQHTVTAQAGAGLEEKTTALSGMKAAYDASNRSVVLNFASLSSGEMTMNFVDMNGRSVFKTQIGSALVGENTHKVQLPSDLKNGIYVVHLLVNNNAASAKVQIIN
jgi:hypothetical protein